MLSALTTAFNRSGGGLDDEEKFRLRKFELVSIECQNRQSGRDVLGRRFAAALLPRLFGPQRSGRIPGHTTRAPSNWRPGYSARFSMKSCFHLFDDRSKIGQNARTVVVINATANISPLIIIISTICTAYNCLYNVFIENVFELQRL